MIGGGKMHGGEVNREAANGRDSKGKGALNGKPGQEDHKLWA
jgi:hypothetical protein